MQNKRLYLYAVLAAIGGSIGTYLRSITHKPETDTVTNNISIDTQNKSVADIAIEYEKIKHDSVKPLEFIQDGVKEKMQNFFRDNITENSFKARFRVEVLETSKDTALLQIVSNKMGEAPIPFYAKSGDNISSENFKLLEKGGVYKMNAALNKDGTILIAGEPKIEFHRIPQDFEITAAKEKLDKQMGVVSR